jgi:hypothetical protein
MRNRCNNPNYEFYKNYGGKGITVCPQWDSFEMFLADMGEQPTGLILDRRNNDLGYSKENCRWVTPAVSSQNRSPVFSNTPFGIKGVYWNRSKRYYAVVCIQNKIKVEILRTKDFFLACCARKSWEMKNVIGQ